MARLTHELRASEWYEPELSFVAEEGGAVVGHVMNTWNWLEGGSPRVLQLSPLGVLPEHQRTRSWLGARPRLARRRPRTRRAAAARRGQPDAYYGRFGFVRADELGLLPPPEALHEAAVQVAVLDPDATLPQGRVVYSEPFRH